MKLLCVVVLLAIIKCTSSLNILGIFPYQGKSHFLVFRVYLQELAKRGHNLTVISYFPEKQSIKNYNDINLGGDVKIIEDDIPFQKSFYTQLMSAVYLVDKGKENCRTLLENNEVQGLIVNKTKFDVVVTEQFNSDCSLGVAYKLKAPVIGMTSHILMPMHYSRFGIPQNPSFVPFHFLDYGTNPTLLQRVKVTIFDFCVKSLFYFIGQSHDQRALGEYFDDIPPLESLARDIKFLFLYHNFILTGSRLFPPNVIEVGGYHVAQAKPLTKDLKKFVDEAIHGVIYISFGSIIRSSTMPADKLAAILSVMEELPQRFIWKWESEILLMDKDKLYVSKWLPQVDILGHSKTLAFLSHGGMGSTTEAIHYGVPMVTMPMFGDQPCNAAAIEESGLGVRIQVEDLTKENLLTAFKEVLDPTFRDKVKKISEAWHDRPLPPMDTAIYWTEFVARHSNFTFRAPSADVPLYQYYNLDIIFVYIFVILVVFLMCTSIISCCCRRNKCLPMESRQNKQKLK